MNIFRSKRTDKFFAMFLACSLIVGMLPISAFASNGNDSAVGVTSVSPGDSSSVSDNDPAEDKVEVSVSVSGNGSVTLNDSEETSLEVEKDSEVALKVTPEVGYYVKAVTVDGEERTLSIAKGEGYQEDITAAANVSIEVVFAKICGVRISKDVVGGSVTLDGEDVAFKDYDEGGTAQLAVTAESGYWISAVTVGGVQQDITDKQSFSMMITVDSIKEVGVSFVKVYTVTVNSGINGSVTTNPEGNGGSVTVSTGTKVTVTATPEQNYRVAEVKINSVPSGQIKGENDESFTTELTVDQDYVIEVTFAPNTFDITVEPAENGSVVVDKTKVDYDNSVSITVKPEEGYTVASITVTGTAETKPELTWTEEGSYHCVIENITENKTIKVEFKTLSTAARSDYSFHVAEALRSEGLLYVFADGTAVVFRTEKDGIRINGQNADGAAESTQTCTLTETTEIEKIELFYQADGEAVKAWHTVSDVTNEKPIQIVYDKTAPKLELVPDAANEAGYYNSDLSVLLKAEDTGDFSGIASVEYWVLCDGNKTQAETVVYTYTDGEEILAEKEIAVEVKADVNDSDNVAFYAKVVDRAGNETTEKVELKINSTRPVVTVEMKDTAPRHAEAEESYYQSERVAVITIKDRSTTFDETAATKGIVITTRNADGEEIAVAKPGILWTHNGDEHTAELRFAAEARYEWNITYQNKAGLTNEGVAANGDAVFRFTIDKTAPEATISIEQSGWNRLLSAITFGIWKNYPVTAEVTVADVNNISPCHAVEYCKADGETVLTESALEALYAAGKFSDTPITVSADEHFVIYARVTDYAGNARYIGTNGVVVDSTLPIITLTPDEANEAGFYSNDINVRIDVAETTNDGIHYSGIKTVTYKVTKADADGSEEMTQSGTLYTFDVSEPGLSDLKREFSDTITVSAAMNNAPRVNVEVTVTDNAGNVSTESIELKVNTVAPTIEIRFDDNGGIERDGATFFQTGRVATIIINDRYDTFNPEAATAGIQISAMDADGNEVALDKAAMISEWSNNGQEHTATVRFDVDGNYTWTAEYTNLAGIKNTEPPVLIGTAPLKFTVDTTLPVGEITINDNKWDVLLNKLTFGLYSKIRADVSATWGDATSPCDVEYFKTADTAPKNYDALDALYEQKEFENYTGAFSVDRDDSFVVYLRVTDYAGNYIYVCSNGYVVDKTASWIGLERVEPNANGMYGRDSDVRVAVKVEDAEPYSGIATVDYLVFRTRADYETYRNTAAECWTQSGNLFTFQTQEPLYEELQKEVERVISVDKEKNHSPEAIVYVRATDNAGNVSEQTISLDINNLTPTVSLTYAGTANAGARSGYYTKRTATIVITENGHYFDADAATASILITAKDSNGANVENAYKISAWDTAQNPTNPDASTHTATISFERDANYTISVNYTDRAGNTNGQVNVSGQAAPFQFTVDSTKPGGTVMAVSDEGRETVWSDLRSMLTYGFWSNSRISVTGTAEDATSPIARIEYYKVIAQNPGDNTTPLTEAELDAVSGWQPLSTVEIDRDEQAAVYLKITDYAGNYSYVGTSGLIVDRQRPIQEVGAPAISLNADGVANGVSNGSVGVSVSVNDPVAGGTYSGLKQVSYRVYDRGSGVEAPTQTGILFDYKDNDPMQSGLVQSWSGGITVEAGVNNSNSIEVVVFAVDNAGNTSEYSAFTAIDTTAPVINVSYDNNTAENNGYFKENRTATVVITERNFRAEDVNIQIVNKDNGEVPAVSGWSRSGGSGNGDNTTWTATISYRTDGDYEFAIAYTDLAGNKSTQTLFENGTVAPEAFVIDKTLPTVNVTYDNNSAENGNYYKEERTATIVVTEHNFDPALVDVIVSATDDGAGITAPSVRGWTSSGDRHTATITYSADGFYSFDIAIRDQAGNESATFERQSFYVDKTAPGLTISGVADRSANSGDVIPVISFSDTNFDADMVEITLVGVNSGEVTFDGEYESQHNGRVFTFANFAKTKEMDDIYTLTVTLTDKAGNVTTESISFSVNRFGSTYALSEATKKLNNTYVKTAEDVVLTEINVNELKNIKVTLFKNNETIVLKEGTDYRLEVAGGDEEWYQYTYIILAKNFEDDGVYRLTIQSDDKAGNTAKTDQDTKNTEISFGVDSTLPVINIKNLESRTTYAVDPLPVEMTIKDNLKLVKVVVELDGVEYKVWSGEELEEIVRNGGNFTIDIPGDSTAAHQMIVYAVDAAGNGEKVAGADIPENVAAISNFYVTTNAWVRYYNNKALFFGSIGGVVGVAGLGTALVVLKRRKIKES